MSRVRFNKLSIVESLQTGDRKTGQLLHEEVMQHESFFEKGLAVEYVQCRTRTDLVEHISMLTAEARATGSYPILHLEAHGTKDREGLFLASGEVISWLEMGRACRELNIACRGNLILVVAACFGVFSSRMFVNMDRAPFCYVVGPTAEVSPDMLLSCFSRFYRYFYGQIEVNSLSDTLRLNDIDQEIILITAESLFVDAFRYLYERLKTPGYFERSAREMRALVMPEISRDPTSAELEAWIKYVRQQSGKPYFEHRIREFFMVDLFPENIDKFTVTYEAVFGDL